MTIGKKKLITSDDYEIGKKLRRLRETHGISQKSLGTIASVSYQQIQKYEAGKNRIPASKLNKFSKIFGVSLDYFFTKEPTLSKQRINSEDINANIQGLWNDIKHENIRIALMVLMKAIKELSKVSPPK